MASPHSTPAQPTDSASSLGQETNKLCADWEFNDPKRIQLLQTLESLAPNRQWPREVWAFLWLSDIEILEKQVEDFRNGHRIDLVIPGLDMIVAEGAVAKNTQKASLPGTPGQISRLASSPSQPSPSHQAKHPTTPAQKRKRSDDSSPPSPSLSSTRSKTAKDRCRKRDNNRCIITKADVLVDVANVFPFSMRGLQTPVDGIIGAPWDVLRQFWTDARVSSWYTSITTAAGTETVEKLLSLAPHVHAYHGRAYFALQPRILSEDKKQLTVGFYWLPHMSKLPKKVSLLTTPEIPNSLDMHGDPVRSVKLWNIQSEQKICSGDELLFETADPKRLPLPSWELLDMQWVLQRLLALAGAADAEDDFESDDDDEGCRIFVNDGEGTSNDLFQEWMVNSQAGQKEKMSSETESTPFLST
ncbi:hypothetical protein AJ80_00538 [Polytolypa hystricis UAMH7299]|uniref:Uncharacterized protein n=1 Tax=Polytolypa hystricis (strain UAMH7299) TaxID=1447883 RepID=A0A2B7Z2X3_POLH7|nr:hypothetical protein AJ80_00538 [Polytolypa hystricis UAMH7299]